MKKGAWLVLFAVFAGGLAMAEERIKAEQIVPVVKYVGLKGTSPVFKEGETINLKVVWYRKSDVSTRSFDNPLPSPRFEARFHAGSDLLQQSEPHGMKWHARKKGSVLLYGVIWRDPSVGGQVWPYATWITIE